MRAQLRVIVSAAAVAMAVAGCGSGGSSPVRSSSNSVPSGAVSPTTPQPSATSSATAAGPIPCEKGFTAFWLPGPDHSKVEANSIGTGSTAVVFLHQVGIGADMCGFSTFARWLADKHQVMSVLVNRCGYGATTCATAPPGDAGIVALTAPAVAWARAHGAHRVSIVGASAGGGDAIQAAGAIPAIAAVVDISGTTNDTGTSDVSNAKRVKVPALYAAAPNDSSCSLPVLRGMYRATPAAKKQLVILSDYSGVHGWSLLMNGDGTPLRLAGIVASWVLAA